VLCSEFTLFAENVVVATGAYHTPRVPAFARELTRTSSSSTPR
jgi:cation diffusion facilitator CzcD-associated flavoprotein CzcO